MHPRKLVVFVAQAITVGLALAFLLTLFWPGLLRREPTSVEVRETAEQAAQPAGGPVSYATAVERAAPAVVNINTAKVVTIQPNPLLKDPIFQQFFGRSQDSPRKRVERSLGSGVIFRPNAKRRWIRLRRRSAISMIS